MTVDVMTVAEEVVVVMTATENGKTIPPEVAEVFEVEGEEGVVPAGVKMIGTEGTIGTTTETIEVASTTTTIEVPAVLAADTTTAMMEEVLAMVLRMAHLVHLHHLQVPPRTTHLLPHPLRHTANLRLQQSRYVLICVRCVF